MRNKRAEKMGLNERGVKCKKSSRVHKKERPEKRAKHMDERRD